VRQSVVVVSFAVVVTGMTSVVALAKGSALRFEGTFTDHARTARERRSTGDPLEPKYAVDGGNGSMGATERNPVGGVLGFAIAFIAFAFGGALSLPPSVRVLVFGAGVILALLSAGMTGFGSAALVLVGIVLILSMTTFGVLGASRDQVSPRIPSVDETTGPTADGGYILTLSDKQWIEATWRRRSEAEQRRGCAAIRDGVSDAELRDAFRRLQHVPRLGLAAGIPTDETAAFAFLRAGYAHTETELC
jgi:hypothetical protein